MVDQRESQAGTWSEPCTTLDPAMLSGLPLIFGSDLRVAQQRLIIATLQRAPLVIVLSSCPKCFGKR